LSSKKIALSIPSEKRAYSSGQKSMQRNIDGKFTEFAGRI